MDLQISNEKKIENLQEYLIGEQLCEYHIKTRHTHLSR
jgi:hypothetical protein